MKTIIIPTDFSSISLNAANYGADLAVATGAELLLMNIISIPMTVAEIPMTESTFTTMEESAAKELAHLKEKLLLHTKEKLNIRTFSEIGTVNYELEEICKREKPFTVVMSSKNNEAVERFFIGSNTLSAIQHIHYPILIVPENYSFKKIEKITLACDLNHAIDSKTIKAIKDWISFFKASLHIINVNKKTDISSNAVPNSIDIEKQLSSFQPKIHLIHKENIKDGINEFLEKEKPDVLILIPQKHGLFHKSLSKLFVLHPKMPVLTIREYA